MPESQDQEKENLNDTSFFSAKDNKVIAPSDIPVEPKKTNFFNMIFQSQPNEPKLSRSSSRSVRFAPE